MIFCALLRIMYIAVYLTKMNPQPNKQSFIELIEENKGIIYKICRSYCRNPLDIQDLSQEMVYHLWKAFQNYNPEFRFSTWMYRIALNVAISFYRKESKTGTHIPFSENLEVFEESPDVNAESEANLQALMRFISGLKEIDKSIMLLYLEDKTYREISEITGITETNVATKINRIKDKLRAYYLTS